MEANSESDVLPAYLPLLAVNLLPLAGVALFGWRADELLFVYWLEIGFAVVLYGALIPFGQREPRPTDRRRKFQTDPISVPARSGTVQPVGWLPAIHYRNVRYVPTSLAFGLVFWFFSSVAFVNAPNPDTATGARPEILEMLALVGATASLEGLALAVVLFAVRLAVVWDRFVGHRQYERFSASMLADVPCRIGTFLLPLSVGAFVLTLPVGSQETPFVALALLVPSKLFLDWSLLRVLCLDASGRLSFWFVPDEPS